MKSMAKRVLAVFLAVAMVVLLLPLTQVKNDVYAAGKTVDEVRKEIQGLSIDARDYSASDKARVEAIKADFDALSKEDQNTLDAETSHPNSGQPLGRVLEAALWTVWSFAEPDNSTTLPDGTYTVSTDPAVTSEYSKGKSTSSRQKPWSVKEVVVEGGKATATIMVESTTYSGIMLHGKTYPRTNTSGNCEFAGVPIDLNSTFYFNGVSTSMPTPIAFSLTTTVAEPGETGGETEGEADYSAVDAALMKVPEDLSIYTEETASAVTEAVNAVVRGKTESEQAEVDAMAKAIEDAVAALVKKEAEDPDPTPSGEEPSEDPDPTPSGEEPSEDPDPTPSGEEPSENPDPTPSGEEPSENPDPTPSGEEPSENPDPTPSGEEPSSADSDVETISLYPSNNEPMFKVVNAFLEKKDGKYTLVFALNAKGYEDVIQATFAEAMAKGKDKSDWIHYSPAEVEVKYVDKYGSQDDGIVEKYQFRMPVEIAETGETTIPVISISNREAQNAEKAAGDGVPDYSSAFKARKFVIDIDKKTLITGNYDETVDITVSSEIESFKVESAGTMYVFGAASTNDYKLEPTITMQDDTYDMVFIGAAADAAESDAERISEEKTFTLRFYNSHNPYVVMINGTEPITAAFHVAASGEWIERQFVIDVDAKTVTISGEEIKTEDELKDIPANYKPVEDAKAGIPADLSIFTDDSVKAVNDAVSAVVEDLTADRQAEVDKMGSDISAAVSALKLKDGVYAVPSNSQNNDMLDIVIDVKDGKMTAYITMSGRSQDKIFAGTAAEAEASSSAIERLGLVKNSAGSPKAALFAIQLEAINDDEETAIHNGGLWGDRTIRINAVDLKKADYQIKDGSDTEIVPGEELIIISEADFSKFAGVLADGELVDASNYTAVSSSTKVTFTADFTQTLAEGKHEIVILSHDGMSKAELETRTVQPETDPGNNSEPGNVPDEAPATGDSSNMTFYIAVLITSIACAVYAVFRRKTQR